MNTYTNSIQPKKKIHQTAGNKSLHSSAIATFALILVIGAAIAVYMGNRPTVAAPNNPAVPFSNALEMQYAQPWLDAQNKPVVAYGNALELQYAQSWLDKAEEQIALDCHSSLEMFYACKCGSGRP